MEPRYTLTLCLVVVLLLLCLPYSDASHKKGVAVAVYCSPCNWNCRDPAVLGANFWWNWDYKANGCGATNPEFIPMIWGRKNVQNLGQIEPGTKWLQGFNEPNYAAFGQDIMSPDAAAAYWPQFMQTGRALISPGVSVCWYGHDDNCIYDAWAWLDRFTQIIQQNNWRLDAIAIHIYTADIGVVMNAVNTACSRYPGKQIWLTEFNAGSNDPNVEVNFIHQIFPQLENSCVARYSWVEARGPDGASCIDNSDHNAFVVTSVGKAYMQY